MFCVPFSGPKLRFVLFWKGRLIRLPTGFCASFASSSALSSAWTEAAKRRGERCDEGSQNKIVVHVTLLWFASYRRADCFDERVVRKGLAQQRHAARVADRTLERDVVAGRDEHDRNIAVRGRELRLRFEAGESVHVDIDNRAVGTARGERCEERLAGGERRHMVVG